MEPHPVQSLIVSPDILSDFISDFENKINSKRLQSKIKSIEDLIIVLYKRNEIDRNNYSIVLQNILNHFSGISEKAKIKDFVYLIDRQSVSCNANVNQYGKTENLPGEENITKMVQVEFVLISALQRILHTKSSGRALPHSSAANNQSTFIAKKSQIYKVIANEMENWREFGRELNISEPVLHNLDRQFDRDIPTITRQILELVEARQTENIFEQIIEALEENGRNDIIKRIKIILNQ